MTTTVNGLFDDRDDAANAVNEIQAAGISKDEISIVTNKVDGQSAQRSAGDRMVDNNMAESGTGDGALIGGVLGGGAGLLAGLGTIVIPGLGPLLGVGWLITTAIGAAVGASGGGLIGALVGAGVDNDDAQVYVDRIRTGGTLVSVRVADADVDAIAAIMSKYNGIDSDRETVAVVDPGDRLVTRTMTRETTTTPLRPVPPAE
jgi:hypothetical protein